MSNERRWPAYDATPFTANGTLDGVVTVADTFGLYTKMTVALTSNTQPQQSFKVNAVLSPTQVQLGPVDKDLTVNSNLTAFTTADNATIFASRQAFGSINPENITNAVYAREPIVALRTIGTDKYGKYYDKDNPLPVDATFTGELSVDLDGYSQANSDSVNITGSDDGTSTGIKRGARVDSELDLRVGISDGANKATVDGLGQLSVADAASHAFLSAIVGFLNTNPSKLAIGTEDGTLTGVQRVFVNNRVQQILAAKDRNGTISYADFGTKDQRITQITYTAPSIGVGVGFTAQKNFTYTLIGNRYRRDTPGNWVLV